MAKKVLVILGTARDESNTLKAIRAHLPFKDYELIELHKMDIGLYEYANRNTDDFLDIALKMSVADTIVFATPVYWYAMSGVLKVFFDRLTELITTSKDVGRALKGKEVYLLATGSEEELPEGFEVPFKKTSEYFDMHYMRAYYFKM